MYIHVKIAKIQNLRISIAGKHVAQMRTTCYSNYMTFFKKVKLKNGKQISGFQGSVRK